MYWSIDLKQSHVIYLHMRRICPHRVVFGRSPEQIVPPGGFIWWPLEAPRKPSNFACLLNGSGYRLLSVS